MIGKMWHIEKNGKNVPYLGAAAKPGKFCNFSPLLNLKIVFPVFPAFPVFPVFLTDQKLLFKYEHFFFMKTADLIKKSVLSSTNILCLLTKYKINGTSKIPISKRFSDLGKIWKCNLGLYSKDLVFNLFYELGKIEKPSYSNIQKSQNLFLNLEESGSPA